MFGFQSNTNEDEEASIEKRQPSSIFNVRYRGDVKVAPKMVAIDHKFAMLLSDASDTGGSMIDVVAFVIFCKQHNHLATYSIKSSVDEVRWLPFTPLMAHLSFEESAQLGAALILSDNNESIFNELKKGKHFEMQFLELLRIQLPHNLKFLKRVIYFVALVPSKDENVSGPHFQCCRNTSQLTWVDVQNLGDNQFEGTTWGPELVQYSRVVLENFSGFTERISEISLDEVYYYVPRDPPRNVEEKLLLELNVKEKLIETLYIDFLEHCYPAITLPFGSFKHYMFKFGFEYNDQSLSPLFIAFNYQRNGYISFNELLMGLACIDPQASHGETRLKFIFRFYDNSKGYLDKENFTVMNEDIYPTLDNDQVARKVEEGFRQIRTETRPDGKVVISFANLTKAVGSLKFRGTSSLCRSTTLVFSQLARAYAHKRVPNLTEGFKGWHNIKSVLTSRRFPTGASSDCDLNCAQCKKEGDYRLASHVIEINQYGWIGKPVKMLGLKKRLVDTCSDEYLFKLDSLPNRIIRMVREFSTNKGTVSNPRGLLQVPDQMAMVDIIKALANTLKPILERESRCPDVPQPAFIVGDIHGNLEDLLTLERHLWRQFPCSQGNYVFLGDYVDRGRWSIECALYLMAMKCLAPRRVILLRGNHEIRAVQEKYSFKKECLKKYGEQGADIWEVINSIFDFLPIAGTVDRAVFCVHGGLSPKASTYEDINNMLKCIPSPEEECDTAWEMMWSDPCHMQKYLDIIEMSGDNNPHAHEGYLHNSKRGAGYLFNEKAVANFLMRNNLAYLVRAHEVPTFGFTHHFRNLCTTVFSCSHYCNSDNEASVILVDENRLRVLRIDTRNNASATDP